MCVYRNRYSKMARMLNRFCNRFCGKPFHSHEGDGGLACFPARRAFFGNDRLEKQGQLQQQKQQQQQKQPQILRLRLSR
jgi:hypothetical protein